MKASLLAISISSVLTVPVFASAPQVDVELADQQTLQLIDGQMNAIDASVQYKLNEQYANATPGTTATVDDVTYEKQSNGTWAAVGAASAALVAGLLNSSSSSQDSQSPTLPIEAIPDNELPGSPSISNPIERERPIVDKPKPGYDGITVDERGGVYYIEKNGVKMGAIFKSNDDIIWNPNGGDPVVITKDLVNGKLPGDKISGIHPDKPGYDGITVDERGGVYYIEKNGVKMGAIFKSNDDIIWNPNGGDPVVITKDLVNGKLPGDKISGIHPDKPGYDGITVDERGGVYYIEKNGVKMGAIFKSNDDIIWNPNGGDPVVITKDLVNGKLPGDKISGIHPDKPGYDGITVDERGGVYYIEKNGVKMGAIFKSNDDIIWNPNGGDPVVITKDLVNGKLPGDKISGIHPDKPGYDGITVDERGGVYYIEKNGVKMGAIFKSNDDIIWNPNGGDPVVITKDLVNGKLPGDKISGIHPDKPGYDGITVDERGGVYYIEKNGVKMGAIFKSNDDIIWNPNGGDPVVITKDLVNGKLPSSVNENLKDRVQSIDPTRLQKAKSAIQQRLRG
ncbi:hypothetical protein [Vibrio splendidus]|uniref:hypothetical protein n=1 Tax=Vibrio splendidus TaxID=29497 RepID=UPI0021B230EA|nr:hypothetical protein [Vibrio splendidus]UWZ99110.1 hypothetical protein IM698_07135 [Vibrio splendidus]